MSNLDIILDEQREGLRQYWVGLGSTKRSIVKAVKELRAELGTGLKETKDYVDELFRQWDKVETRRIEREVEPITRTEYGMIRHEIDHYFDALNLKESRQFDYDGDDALYIADVFEVYAVNIVEPSLDGVRSVRAFRVDAVYEGPSSRFHPGDVIETTIGDYRSETDVAFAIATAIRREEERQLREERTIHWMIEEEEKAGIEG